MEGKHRRPNLRVVLSTQSKRSKEIDYGTRNESEDSPARD